GGRAAPGAGPAARGAARSGGAPFGAAFGGFGAGARAPRRAPRLQGPRGGGQARLGRAHRRGGAGPPRRSPHGARGARPRCRRPGGRGRRERAPGRHPPRGPAPAPGRGRRGGRAARGPRGIGGARGAGRHRGGSGPRARAARRRRARVHPLRASRGAGHRRRDSAGRRRGHPRRRSRRPRPAGWRHPRRSARRQAAPRSSRASVIPARPRAKPRALRARIVRLGTALLALQSPAPGAAQTSAALDLAATRVAYDGVPGASAFTLAPMLQVTRPLASLFAGANFWEVDGGGWSLQGSAAGSLFTPGAAGFRLEAGGSASGSTHEDGTSTGSLLGRARLHWMTGAGGVWGGGGLGRATDGLGWRATREIEAGAWLRGDPVTLLASAAPTWI